MELQVPGGKITFPTEILIYQVLLDEEPPNGGLLEEGDVILNLTSPNASQCTKNSFKAELVPRNEEGAGPSTTPPKGSSGENRKR